MITALLALMISTPVSLDPDAASPRVTLVEQAQPHGRLRDELVAKLKAMNDADRGIFHDDVTSTVAPYFPWGQTLAETKAVLDAQKLGPLRRFHGKGDGSGTAVYVSRAELMDAAVSDVHVVIDFNFEGASEPEMVLKKVGAYLEAPSM